MGNEMSDNPGGDAVTVDDATTGPDALPTANEAYGIDFRRGSVPVASDLSPHSGYFGGGLRPTSDHWVRLSQTVAAQVNAVARGEKPGGPKEPEA